MLNKIFSLWRKCRLAIATVMAVLCLMSISVIGQAQTTVEFNSLGGTSSTNGLHFYIDRTSKIQVRRLNNTGQVYSPTALPASAPNSLDNGVFLRANNLVYGPSHTVMTFNPTGGMYNTYAITATTPPNPSTNGVLQTATSNLGVTNGPQITIVWKYKTPNDYLTADVTLVIPPTYTTISASNPVRYYHVFDTYLGGSDNGCGLNIVGTNRIVGTYSGPCGSSSSLPASGIVESFRERGRPFSAYCAAGWSTFFATGSGTTCSVLQTNPLNNTITTTLQDTGIGIEFDFTATGTYTFSYDFVVGTTAVPDYDHIEIRHDGSATLCPENMIVLACKTAGVPCDPSQILESGTLTGNIALNPTASGVTYSPPTFSLGLAASTANVSLQATSASAGTYTLYATNLSDTPINGTKCASLDGTTATTCLITITNTRCASNFECLETSLAYNNLNPPTIPAKRNPLYTKVAKQGFRFDVLALQASGNIASNYTGNVSVELIDDTSGAACAVPSALATQSLNFASTDNGRKTLTADFLVNDAYKKLRCRVKESLGTSPITACSSDQFTVRPSSFVSLTSNANADDIGNSTTSSPKIAAGNDFTLTANTNTKGYDGLPKIDTTLLQWPNVPSVVNGGRAAPGTGSLSGSFTTAANAATGNGATGSAFKYDEVGYFRIRAQGLYDDTFVANAAAADSTVDNNDCIKGSSSNVIDTSTDALKKGRYGCNFANTADTNHFGRFIPHHFTISSASTTEACTSVTPFTYFGQDGAVTSFVLTAKNSSDVRTQNYTSTFVKFDPVVYANYGFTLSAPPAGVPAGAVLTSGAVAPTGSWLAGNANIVANHQISRPTALTNETIITINASPTDGEVTTATPLLVSTTRQRYGRMKLQSAYGSEMLDLPVPYIAEYYNGNLWIKNTDDSCTPVVAPSAGAGITFYADSPINHLTTGKTTASVSATAKLVAGDSKLKFSKPGVGNSGYIDLTIPVFDWLKFPWRGGATAIDPSAKVKFGSYKKSNQFIYTREVH